jgi:hypothetical protein
MLVAAGAGQYKILLCRQGSVPEGSSRALQDKIVGKLLLAAAAEQHNIKIPACMKAVIGSSSRTTQRNTRRSACGAPVTGSSSRRTHNHSTSL